jgi:hypothetical protein
MTKLMAQHGCWSYTIARQRSEGVSWSQGGGVKHKLPAIGSATAAKCDIQPRMMFPGVNIGQPPPPLNSLSRHSLLRYFFPEGLPHRHGADCGWRPTSAYSKPVLSARLVRAGNYGKSNDIVDRQIALLPADFPGSTLSRKARILSPSLF